MAVFVYTNGHVLSHALETTRTKWTPMGMYYHMPWKPQERQGRRGRRGRRERRERRDIWNLSSTQKMIRKKRKMIREKRTHRRYAKAVECRKTERHQKYMRQENGACHQPPQACIAQASPQLQRLPLAASNIKTFMYKVKAKRRQPKANTKDDR